MSTTPGSTSASTSSTGGTSKSFVEAKKGAPASVKPLNVFSNDGSFLERFRKESETKGKTEKESALARKKLMDDRIKNRGKRAAGPETPEESAAKRSKPDSELTEYQLEVKRLKSLTGLKDEGYGTRATLK